MEGEDKIVESMRRFANDAKCVEYLKTFKEAFFVWNFAAPGISILLCRHGRYQATDEF